MAMTRSRHCGHTEDPAEQASTVAVHGPVLRHLRMQRELSMRDLATEIGVSESYINRLELGYNTRVSVRVFRRLRVAVGLGESQRRVLMADPYGQVPA